MASLPSKKRTFTKWNHFHSSKSRLSWSEKSAPHNFFNIHNCQTIQLNYQIFFCDSPHASCSTQPTGMNQSVTGQQCAESEETFAGSPLTDSSLMVSSWSLPTCGESPGSKPIKSPKPSSTSEAEGTLYTIPPYLFNESMTELPLAESGC